MRAPNRILISARILLGQTQRELAAACGFTQKTIYLIEKGEAGIGAVEKLMEHYEGRGITFIAPNGDEGWGVRTAFLKKAYERERKE